MISVMEMQANRVKVLEMTLQLVEKEKIQSKTLIPAKEI